MFKTYRPANLERIKREFTKIKKINGTDLGKNAISILK